MCAGKVGKSWNVYFLEPQLAQKSGQSTSYEEVGQMCSAAEDSIATNGLPLTVNKIQEHLNQDHRETQLPYAVNSPRRFNEARTAHALKLAHTNKSSTPSQVGWVDKPASSKNALICHSCYEWANHISATYTLCLNGICKTISNYEALNKSEMVRVQSSNYKDAQAYIIWIYAESNDAKVEKSTDQSKNRSVGSADWSIQ